MAGIGVKLNKIYSKGTITTNLIGLGYSSVITVAPMFLVILSIIVMQLLLDGFLLGYSIRLLFSCAVMYIFIFSLLVVSPFNSVLSKYLSDVIYNEKYEDILPCFYMGMLLTMGVGFLLGVPFCAWAYLSGNLTLPFVCACYGGFMLLILVLYAMLYLSICKDYGKISLYYFLGAVLAVIMALVLVDGFGVPDELGMLIALDLGFLLTAALEIGKIRAYFRRNSGNYAGMFRYFPRYWKLIFSNLLYTLGLYVHNFVFWTSDLRLVVADTFVCAMPYDMASCLAVFTNISASVIFISRVEMHFHDRYRLYSEAVIGGRWKDIENAKKRMFRQLSEELMSLARVQFIVTVIVFLLAIIFLPQYGYSGLVMSIYPCMAAGYFALFLMYAVIIFLYYFNDLTGSLLTAGSFFLATLLGSVLSTHLPEIWYGLGVTLGSFVGWCVSYFRVRYLERHLDEHIFCTGRIMKVGKGVRPDSKVFDRYRNDEQNQPNEKMEKP